MRQFDCIAAHCSTMKRVIFSCLVFLLTILCSVPHVLAEDCAANDIDCLNRKIEEYKNKISELQGQQQTLSSAIRFLDSKVQLTENEIQKTQAEISMLQAQIGELGVRISGLEVSLKKVSEQLIARIQDMYKERYRSPPITLLFSDSFAQLLTKQKYARLSRGYTEAILREAEKQRVVFAQEKDLKEQKQREVKALQAKLAKQRDVLGQQQNDKKKVLEETKNDERKYQELLSIAEAQKKAFGRFISSQGGATILGNQTRCNDWGCYYNQRDEKWGKLAIGNSNETMNQYGCLITSMAMVGTHYGKKITPGDIAVSSNPFYLSTALMLSGSWTVNGITASRIRIPALITRIDAEVSTGRPVVVGVYGGPDHFLVIKGKSDKGYVMHDPFPENGNDKIFTDRYRLSDITTADMVRY